MVAMRTLRVMQETLALEKEKHLREHYAGTKRQWRFIVGVRLGVILGFLSAHSVLLNVYWGMLLRPAVPTIYHWTALVTAAFSIVFTQSLYTIHKELYRMQRSLEHQGMSEEDVLHDQGGIFHRMQQYTVKDAPMQFILKYAFHLVFFVWIVLGIISILAITGRLT